MLTHGTRAATASHGTTANLDEQNQSLSARLHTFVDSEPAPSSSLNEAATGGYTVSTPPLAIDAVEVDVNYPAQTTKKKSKKGRQSGGWSLYD